VVTAVGGPVIKKLFRKKIGGKGENLVWPWLPKILDFSIFFLSQSQPNHNPIMHFFMVEQVKKHNFK
jgi:hypothetical protein